MSQALLQRLFPGDVHHIEGLHAELSRHLQNSRRLLDLGCGVNTGLAMYRRPDCEVWGADFKAHPQLQHANWFRVLGRTGTIPFPDQYFDIVTTVMVLEHVTAPHRFFQEVARVLGPGGVFVGHSISGSHYVAWIRRALGLLPHSFNAWLVRRLYGRPEVDTFPAFYRLNRRGQIAHWGRRAGLALVRMHRYADPNYFNFSARLRAAAITADWILEHVAAGWGRLYFTVTLQKDSQPATIQNAA